MTSYLNRPSPLMNTAASRWILVVSISTFIFVFLWAFRPFGVFNSFVVSSFEASLGYATVTLLVTSSYIFGLNNRLASYYGQRWTVGRHLIAIFFNISMIGVVNGIYAQNILNETYLNQNDLVDIYLSQFGYTHAVGLFPVVLVLLIFELRERNYYVEQSSHIQKKTQEEQLKVSNDEVLEIKGDNASEHVRILSSDFLFARASGNYVELHYIENGRIVKEVLRLSLSGLMDQINNETWAFQTHRSYLVNLNAIASVQGNAQGYTLLLRHSEVTIPVSRGKISAFNDVMNGIQA